MTQRPIHLPLRAGEASRAPPLLLLHGTGGDENDLLQLGETISLGRRCFRRAARCWNVACPLLPPVDGGRLRRSRREKACRRACGFRPKPHAIGMALDAPVALGYSNGANIAAAMMLLRPQVLAGAVLLRAMVPLAHLPKADLAHRPVLISSGSRGSHYPCEQFNRTCHSALRAPERMFSIHIMPAGHQLAQADVSLQSNG